MLLITGGLCCWGIAFLLDTPRPRPWNVVVAVAGFFGLAIWSAVVTLEDLRAKPQAAKTDWYILLMSLAGYLQLGIVIAVNTFAKKRSHPAYRNVSIRKRPKHS
jgi:hypothetical protein